MQIKLQLRKLNLKLPLTELIDSQQRENNLSVLPVTLEHIYALQNLPAHHKDPFDRLLVAQAMVEDAILVSHDSALGAALLERRPTSPVEPAVRRARPACPLIVADRVIADPAYSRRINVANPYGPCNTLFNDGLSV